jgi:uncharacterized protein (DUF1778 family)
MQNKRINARVTREEVKMLDFLAKLSNTDKSQALREAIQFAYLNSLQFDREMRVYREPAAPRPVLKGGGK